jgi:site-specific DNA-methyltransferase (adenine-specific)
MRETLNKLHGTYNKEKESSELLAIFENQKLDELAELLAQPKQDLENLISKYNPSISFEREEDETKLPSLYDTKSFVVKGEVWQLGKHYLMCGDSKNDLPILLENIKPDLLLTDPPYGLDFDNAYFISDGPIQYGKAVTKTTEYRHHNLEWDKQIPTQEFFNQVCEITKNQIVFGGNYFTHNLKPSRCWIVWDKRTDDKYNIKMLADCELAWTSFDQNSKVYRHLWQGMMQQDMSNKEIRYHPTQKPVKLLADIIKDYSQENDIVLDVFGGSGSTLIACEQTNRKCYMMEIDEHYCSVIIKRWENYTGLKAKKV